MPISFDCPSCRVRMTVPEQYAGQKARCKGCGHKLVVPAAPRPNLAPAHAGDDPFADIDSPGGGDAESSPRRSYRRAGASGGSVTFALLLAFCLLPIGGLSLYQKFGNMPNANVTDANYDRIKVGMTLEQVEDFLGRGSSTRSVYDGAGNTIPGDWIRWNAKRGAIAVRLDNRGRVAEKLSNGTLE